MGSSRSRATSAQFVLAACGLVLAGVPSAAQRPVSQRRSVQTEVPHSIAHAPWTRRAVIYEVNVRQFTPEGTFAALERHLPQLDSLGVDILWLMPVQPIGVKERKGTLGSYYSISNYRDVNPEYGSKTEFASLVAAAHRRGKHVILDWVPNHTAYDHVWIGAHPDWYVHRADGSISRPIENGKETDWTDVAQLDFRNQDMRRAMIADMRWWVDSIHVDGFRCDHAIGAPLEFWADARRELLAANPALFMLAEVEGSPYHASFDMTYGWELHHLLNDIATGKKPAREIDAYFRREAPAYPRDAYRMYFTSDHDENSWQGTEFERMGANHQAAFIVSATVEGSMPLLYTGQEVSLHKRLRFFEKDTVDWSGPSLVPFYSRVFALKHENAALANGASGGVQRPLASNGGERVYAFTRTRGANTVLVAVNFGDEPARIAYRALSRPGRYRDWFGRSMATLGASGRLDIPAHGYRVLVQ